MREIQVTRAARLVGLGLVLLLGSCAQLAQVNTERLRSAAGSAQGEPGAVSETGQWMSYGRTWDEQRFSPLKGIDETNVGRLAWPGTTTSRLSAACSPRR